MSCASPQIAGCEEDIESSGFLLSRKGKSVKRMWFVLKDHVLYMYKASSVSTIQSSAIFSFVLVMLVLLVWLCFIHLVTFRRPTLNGAVCCLTCFWSKAFSFGSSEPSGCANLVYYICQDKTIVRTNITYNGCLQIVSLTLRTAGLPTMSTFKDDSYKVTSNSCV